MSGIQLYAGPGIRTLVVPLWASRIIVKVARDFANPQLTLKLVIAPNQVFFWFELGLGPLNLAIGLATGEAK